MHSGPDFSAQASAEATCNYSVFDPASAVGHYESFFQRCNHPTRPLAFWQRYTVFSPRHAPDKAIGELWAVFFDGENGRHVAVKQEFPIGDCAWRRDALGVRIADAELAPGRLRGEATSGGHRIAWDLGWSQGTAPLFFFPLKLYRASLPKAKALVGVPFAVFSGRIDVDGRNEDLTGWVGSQNHNWGSKHTDHYAWGQVAGFDEAGDAFLEVGTARIKIGPFWTPYLTPLVLRLGDETIAANALGKALRNQGSFAYLPEAGAPPRERFEWRFAAETDVARIEGRISAPPSHFVGLTYYNPPGGHKTCLNSKLAACELRVVFRDGRPEQRLQTRHRAAFEILTDDDRHGVPVHV